MPKFLLRYDLATRDLIGFVTDPRYTDAGSDVAEAVELQIAQLRQRGVGTLEVDNPPDQPDRFQVEGGALVTRPAAEQEERDKAAALDFLRMKRNRLLAATDWTQNLGAPVDQLAWRDYRQALRDLPANTADPRYPVWPKQPDG